MVIKVSLKRVSVSSVFAVTMRRLCGSVPRALLHRLQVKAMVKITAIRIASPGLNISRIDIPEVLSEECNSFVQCGNGGGGNTHSVPWEVP